MTPARTADVPSKMRNANEFMLMIETLEMIVIQVDPNKIEGSYSI